MAKNVTIYQRQLPILKLEFFSPFSPQKQLRNNANAQCLILSTYKWWSRFGASKLSFKHIANLFLPKYVKWRLSRLYVLKPGAVANKIVKKITIGFSTHCQIRDNLTPVSRMLKSDTQRPCNIQILKDQVCINNPFRFLLICYHFLSNAFMLNSDSLFRSKCLILSTLVALREL